MGNCIEFDPTKSIGDAKISYNRKFEENIDKRYRMIKEMQRDVSRNILENAENAVKAAGLKGMEFVPETGSAQRLASVTICQNHHEWYTFHAEEGGKHYILYTSAVLLPDNSLNANSGICVEECNNVAYFDFKKQKWITTDAFLRMHRLFLQNGIETVFMRKAAELASAHPISMNAEKMIASLEKNREILGLCRDMGHIAGLSLFNDGGDIQVFAVPADKLRCGGGIRWDGEQYQLCQYLSPSEYVHAALQECRRRPAGPGGSTQILAQPLVLPVFESQSGEEVREAAGRMWDRYAGNALKYTFPLSKSAFVETERPYNFPYRIYTADTDGAKNLDAFEEANLDFLYTRFRPLRDKQD